MLSSRFYLDFENECKLDLSGPDGHGAYRCINDKSFRLTATGFKYKDEPTRVRDYWWSGNQENRLGFGKWLKSSFELDPSFKLVCHYAEYEQIILGRHFGVSVPPDRIICTLAKCAYYGYPLSLDNAAIAVGTSKLKDSAGNAVMKQLLKGEYNPTTAPELYQKLYKYCANDVDVMVEIDQIVPDLPENIYELWCLNNTINLRGIPIDRRAVQNALLVIERIKRENNENMARLTENTVQTIGQVEKILEYTRKRGVEMPDLQAHTVEIWLAKMLPDPVRKVLELRQKAGLTSLGKYKKLNNYIVNGHIYQQHYWYGAHTGRPTGEGPQALNFPRDEDPIKLAYIVAHCPELLNLISDPDAKLKGALRGMICADADEELITWDLSQIEARGTFWLAGEQKGLDLFTTTDPYCTYGRTLFGHEITKKEHPEKRNAAKAAVLAFGFAGGIGAGQRIGVTHRFDYLRMASFILPTATPGELAESDRLYEYYLSGFPPKPLSQPEGMAVDILKQRYRHDFTKVVAYWGELENAFVYGGQAGFLSVDVKPSGLRIMNMPDGSQMFYHAVKIKEEKRSLKYSYEGRNGRESLWKGQLIENAAQKLNEQISCWYRVRADKIAPIIHQCYDEATHRVKADRLNERLNALHYLFKHERPPFIPGLPLAYEMQANRRYGK